jgi:hypothetical protein
VAKRATYDLKPFNQSRLFFMSEPRSPKRTAERTVIVLLLVLLPLFPPLLGLWANDEGYWFTPYIIWGYMIVAAYLLQRYVSHDAV